MAPEEMAHLVTAYVDHHAKRFVWDKDGVLHEQTHNYWAWEKLDRLIHDNPEVGWDAILRILASTQDEFTLSCLAAGALEDLIHYHGPAFIERIEWRANTDPRFQRLLCGVWPGSTPEIWNRGL